MRTITVKGKKLRVRRSGRKNKKFMVEVNGKRIHFGARGYTIAPGTPKGDAYCARSYGIKDDPTRITPNDLSRAMWGCVGKKSRR